MYGHCYTPEEKTFLAAFIPGHTYNEIQSAFTERFGWEISAGQIKGYMANQRINNGLKGWFLKGHPPHNKGRKGYCAPGCEKTWFQKGNMPRNHRPVLSERIDAKDGYTYIKTAEPNKWMLKHRYIWEQAHGEIPKGYIVIFKDNNRNNICLDNLMLISRSQNAVLNHEGMCQYTGDLKGTSAILAEMKIARGKARKACKKVKK